MPKLLKLSFALIAAMRLHAAEPADQAISRLSQVKMFAFGGVGFAGVITQGEKDYDIILSKPSARADFEKVFASGSAEAKSYALVGLHQVDMDKFRSLAAALRSSDNSVQTARGCRIGKRTMADLVKGIEGGEFGPHQK